MEKTTISEKKIWNILNTIPDPEIPVISIVELGVVREIDTDSGIKITITPTYSGCPATDRFIADINEYLSNHGYSNPEIIFQYSPAWTTDWLSENAKEKLRKYGIAPPVEGSHDKGFLFESGPKAVACPQCGSENTELVSQFGSTACKAMYKCKDCLEPFDYFKCI